MLALTLAAAIQSDAQSIVIDRYPVALEATAPQSSLRLSSQTLPQPEKGGYETLLLSTDSRSVIVARLDDGSTHLLGYLDTKASEGMGLPTALEASLLNMNEEEVAKAPTMTMEAIVPMLSSRWGQQAPFNDLCPEKDGVKAVTGCVATAMAQIMRYHQWPLKGEGEAQFKCAYSDEWEQMDFAGTTFDWEWMADSYTSSNRTPREKQAVATLMKACGYAVGMTYGSDGSSANLSELMALVDHFGYDGSTMALLSADAYGQEEWEALIHDHLASYGPVLYTGTRTFSDSHAFVVDGYDGDGFFHVNWGWNGAYDGYFLLSVLDAKGWSTETTREGYSSSQKALVGVTPSHATNSPQETGEIYDLYINALSASVTARGLSLCRYYNPAARDMEVEMALRAVNYETQEETVVHADGIGCYDGSATIKAFSNSSPTFSCANLADGVWELTPIYRYSNEQNWRTPRRTKNCDKAYVKVENGSLSIGGAKYLALQKTSINGEAAPFSLLQVTAIYRNLSDIPCNHAFKMAVFEKGIGLDIMRSSAMSEEVEIGANEEVEVTFTCILPASINIFSTYYVKLESKGNMIEAAPLSIANMSGDSGIEEIAADEVGEGVDETGLYDLWGRKITSTSRPTIVIDAKGHKRLMN